MKRPDEKIERIENSISRFHHNFKIIQNEKKMVISMTLLTILQHTIFFAVTYTVYRAFGQGGASFVKIISAQAFLSMVMAFIPIPGAGIAAEGGFFIIFKQFFESSSINMAILFWRLYTFYLPIIVGSIVMMIVKRKEKKE